MVEHRLHGCISAVSWWFVVVIVGVATADWKYASCQDELFNPTVQAPLVITGRHGHVADRVERCCASVEFTWAWCVQASRETCSNHGDGLKRAMRHEAVDP